MEATATESCREEGRRKGFPLAIPVTSGSREISEVGPYSGHENNRRKTAIISLCEWRTSPAPGCLCKTRHRFHQPDCPFLDTEPESRCAHHSQPSPSKVVGLSTRAEMSERREKGCVVVIAVVGVGKKTVGGRKEGAALATVVLRKEEKKSQRKSQRCVGS